MNSTQQKVMDIIRRIILKNDFECDVDYYASNCGTIYSRIGMKTYQIIEFSFQNGYFSIKVMDYNKNVLGDYPYIESHKYALVDKLVNQIGHYLTGIKKERYE